MITSSGKQRDKEVETSFVHLMQMCMFVIEILQKSKYPSKDLQVFFFKCTTALWSSKENVIFTRGPFGQSLSKITAGSWNVDQSKPDSHLDSQIDPCFLCILIEYNHSRKQHKIGFQMPWWRK